MAHGMVSRDAALQSQLDTQLRPPFFAVANALAMTHAAYTIACDIHGRSAQCTDALLADMGAVETSCDNDVMEALAAARISDQALQQQFRQQRSRYSRPDSKQTPYPKTPQKALDLGLIN